MASNQGLRFQKPGDAAYAKATAISNATSAAALNSRRNALLQDHTRAHQKPAWSPSMSAAFRFLIMIRVSSAMYSIINDCDESFGYWEPLHLLSFPTSSSAAPFQTWEYSPEFAIRSWAFVIQYMPLTRTLAYIGVGKRQIFFAVRLLLAFVSTFIEARFYKAVADTFSARVGRYCLVALACSAGMFEAATALVPSSFAMHATALAYSFWLYPTRLVASDPSTLNVPTQRPFQPYRLLCTTLAFATGAVLGWPYALVLALPFVFEHLFLQADDVVAPNRKRQWIMSRWSSAISVALIAAIIAVPIFIIDTLAYAKSTFVPLNTVVYNLWSRSRGAGPQLYGTEPFSYYFVNLALNFSIFAPLALLSIPLLVITAVVDPRRLQRPLVQPSKSDKGHVQTSKPSGLITLAVLRLIPFYLWLGVLSVQAHKEERFMYPAYPLLCLNAAVSVYLLRSLAEVAFVKVTKSPYRASKSRLFTALTSTLLTTGILLGVLRTVGQLAHYHAPFDVLFRFEGYELPRVVAQHFPHTLSPAIHARIAKGLSPVATEEEKDHNDRGYGAENAGVSLDLSIDLTPLTTELKQPIRLCYGKEWHRFPTHFLVPAGVQVEWIKSDFSGILPKHFDMHGASDLQQPEDRVAVMFDATLRKMLWPWSFVTRALQPGFNDVNREEHDRYVDPASCDYLVDLDYPHRALVGHDSRHEPRYAIDSEHWHRVFCQPFLDAEFSRPAKDPRDSRVIRLGAKLPAALHRAFWLPKSWPGSANLYGDYCLLRNVNSPFHDQSH